MLTVTLDGHHHRHPLLQDGRIVLGGFRDVVPDMEWGVWDDGALHPEVTAALRAYLPARWPGRLPTEQQQQVGVGGRQRGEGKVKGEGHGVRVFGGRRLG